MKLNELQTITPQNLTPKRTKRDAGKAVQALRPKNSERIGVGSFADVYGTEEDPGTVTKIVRRVRDDVNKDPYFKYVSALAKNDRISNNIFFPRIYNVKVLKTKDGEYRYSVEMEALDNLDTLSAEELRMLGEKYFFNYTAFVRDQYAKMKDHSYNDIYKKGSKMLEQLTLIKAMHAVIGQYSHVATYIKDPMLKQALTLIRGLVKNNDHVWADIHKDNIMVRRGPGGPQIVITDPVS